MGEASKLDAEKLLSYSGVLVELLSEDRDCKNLKLGLEQFKALQSQCIADFEQGQSSIQECQKKIDICKQKIAEAKSEVADDSEMDLLQKELDDEIQRGHGLNEKLRVITNEIDDLERQMLSVEEQWQNLKKLEQDEQRAQMKLYMYASVTSIIPNLDDQSHISGHIVEKDRKEVKKFEFDPMNMTVFDTCNNISKMINW